MHMKNKTFKYIFLLLLAALTVLTAGCGSEQADDFKLDEEKLASDIIADVQFDSALQQISEERVSDFIGTEGAQKQIMYMGSGAYADCFGILTMEDETGAKDAEESVKNYLADLEDSFRFYIPGEVAKISDALILRKGLYVVFCVTGDMGGAEKVILSNFDGGYEAENKAESDKINQNEDLYDVIETDGEIADYGNIVVIGDAAYELYSYTEKAAETYAGYINQAAAELEGQAHVYSIIAPLSSGVTLPDRFYGEIKSSGQEKSLEKLYAKMNDKVAKVNVYENMMKHRTEYIYFRTDHHWTALGAYYGYEVFCDAKGVEPVTLDGRRTEKFEDFRGSFYKDTGENEALGDNPDTIEAYHPVSSDVSLKYYKSNGKAHSWWVISDVSDYPENLKYSTFIAGDNPLTVIENKEITDGSACVVVKESFGNAFVPFLVDHYQTVYVVDFRYWEGDIVEFTEEKGAEDLIFVNSISMTRSDYLTGRLGQIMDR